MANSVTAWISNDLTPSRRKYCSISKEGLLDDLAGVWFIGQPKRVFRNCVSDSPPLGDQDHLFNSQGVNYIQGQPVSIANTIFSFNNVSSAPGRVLRVDRCQCHAPKVILTSYRPHWHCARSFTSSTAGAQLGNIQHYIQYAERGIVGMLLLGVAFPTTLVREVSIEYPL